MPSEMIEIPLDDIFFDQEFNSRGPIAPIDVIDLAKDIAERGLINPVSVVPCSEKEKEEQNANYKLVAGFCRYMAHKINKAKTISAIVREEIKNEIDARLFNLSENLIRKHLNIMQEARAVQKFHDLGLNRQEIALRTGMGDGWVQVRMMLLKLPEPIQEEASAGIIKQTNIRELYTIYNNSGEEATFKAARHIKEARARGKKNVTVNPKKIDVKSKVHRSRHEILGMLDHQQKFLPNDLHTRNLAWAAGEISTEELNESMEQFADEIGANFLVYNLKERILE